MADGTFSNFIRKRDGRIVPFNPEKITDAIYKAAQAVGGSDKNTARTISESILGILNIIYKDGRIPTVENVQDLVEKMLIERGHAKVAKAYILYREQHRKIREGKSLLTEGLELIESYLDRSDWRVNENSNMSYSLQGLNNHIATAITAKYWLERIYPPEIRNSHMNCDFHIHDLGLLSAYCVGWDLKDLLLLGFGGVKGKVESKPAKHFRSALGHIVNFFYTLQGESAGAQAFGNFDTYLAPFIRYDNLAYDEKGEAPDLEDIRKDIGYRDANDISREFAPLTKTEDAVVFDTTDNTLNETKELLLDFVNEELQIKRYKFKRDVIVFIVKSLLKLFYKIEIKGSENVPKDGALIICANHTSYIDVPVLECYIDRLITFVAKKELYKVPVVSFVVKAFDSIPVDRDVKDVSAAKEAYKRLRRGRCIGIFPEGTRSINVIKGKKKYRIRTGAVKLACETSSPILPVGIRSTFKPFSKIEMVIGNPTMITLDRTEEKSGEFFRKESVKLMKEIYSLTGRENEYIDR